MAHDAAQNPRSVGRRVGLPVRRGEHVGAQRLVADSQLRDQIDDGVGHRSPRETIPLTRRAGTIMLRTAELIGSPVSAIRSIRGRELQYSGEMTLTSRPPRACRRASSQGTAQTAQVGKDRAELILVAGAQRRGHLLRAVPKCRQDPRGIQPRAVGRIRGQQRSDEDADDTPMSASPARVTPDPIAGTATTSTADDAACIGMIGPLSRKTAMVIATRTAAAICQAPMPTGASEDRR